MMIKRLLDVLLSFFLLFLLLPILLIIVIVLLLTGEHYVFYSQPRIGLYGKEFMLLKFATMLKNSIHIGSGEITVKRDPRVLPFGRFLRFSKLNELPQLINILKGDMTFIGPRPLTYKHFNYYSDKDKLIVSGLKPGLSGISSIIFRDEELIFGRFELPPEDVYKLYLSPAKASLEGWYSMNKSVKTDLILVFLTLWVIVFKDSQLYNRVFSNLPKLDSNLF
ncbi:MAG: sugar transferase [Sphingobacteriia bacterium]|nr:sugar transferase [Sphingobacteriia bacterium]